MASCCPLAGHALSAIPRASCRWRCWHLRAGGVRLRSRHSRSSRQIVIALLIFVDVALQIQPLLMTATFDPASRSVSAGDRPRLEDRAHRHDPQLRSRRLDPRLSESLRPAIRRLDRVADCVAALRGAVSVRGHASRPRGVDACSPPAMSSRRRRAGRFEPVARLRGVVVHRNRTRCRSHIFDDTATFDAGEDARFTPSSVFIDVDAPSPGDVIVTQQMSAGMEREVDGVARRRA